MHPDLRQAARRSAAEGAIVLALAGAVWLLYGSVLRLWWIYDDFFHLRYLLGHRPFWYLFDAAGYREFPGRVFTPLLFFSLDMDRRGFGIDPRPFYVHQLASLSLCTAVLYGVLRLWLSRLWAAAGAWIFLIGPVTASLAPLLMVRHYVETTILAALAVAAWAGAVRRFPGAGAWSLAWLSSGLYFAACMTKELAVPLFALLPLLPASGAPRATFLERLRLVLPHAGAFVLYLMLRSMALGTLLGGYGYAVKPSNLPALALQLPGKVAAEFVARQVSTAAVLFALALLVGVLPLLRPLRGRTAVLVCLALLLAMLPFLPVATQMEPRKASPAWMVLAVAFAAGGSALAASGSRTRRRASFGLLLLASAAGLWLNRQDWRVRFARVERMSAENRFVLEMTEGDVLRQPLTLAASLKELEWMKEAVYRRPPGGRWFQDDLYLCLHRGSLGRVWGYDPDARRIVDLTVQLPALRARHCSAIVSGAPLHASFHVEEGNLFWDLGPYRDGTYRFVLGNGREVFEMPRNAGFQVPGLPPLRIGYVAPEGWTTYSPEPRLQHVDGWSLRWSRP